MKEGKENFSLTFNGRHFNQVLMGSTLLTYIYSLSIIESPMGYHLSLLGPRFERNIPRTETELAEFPHV